MRREIADRLTGLFCAACTLDRGLPEDLERFSDLVGPTSGLFSALPDIPKDPSGLVREFDAPRSARLRTSSATTENARPCSPAWEEMIAALRASRFVCSTTDSITFTTAPIDSLFSDRLEMIVSIPSKDLWISTMPSTVSWTADIPCSAFFRSVIGEHLALRRVRLDTSNGFRQQLEGLGRRLGRMVQGVGAARDLANRARHLHDARGGRVDNRRQLVDINTRLGDR